MPLAQKIKNIIKRIPCVTDVILICKTVRNRPGLIWKLRATADYYNDIRKYSVLKKNSAFASATNVLKPCILDKTSDTSVDPIYFYQGSWCARKIFENKPAAHVDVGSETKMVGIISQFVPTTMVDIRPVNLSMPGFLFVKGSILELPYPDGSLESVSSICVVEHIGLGRYGDPLDQFGSEKAIAELKRVTAPGGNLYITVPVDDRNRIYFNAHRAFTRDYIIELCAPFELVEEKYIYARTLGEQYDPSQGFGTGLFHFRKLV